MYQAISSLYSNPKSRVILLDYSTDYFSCPMGVKQGDCLSPTLFSIFINDLAQQIKDCGIGVKIEDIAGSNELIVLNILLYADDIVLFAENEIDMQSLLYEVQVWCENWRLEINLSKTNIMHVRPKRRPRSIFIFIINKRQVEYCSFYKYLGCHINEHLDYKFTAEALSDSAGGALSAIITKMIKNRGLPYAVYSVLFNSCVSSISHYASEVHGYEQYNSSLKLHLRAARAFLGLPKNVASYGLISELDWLLPHFQGQLKMVHYYGRLLKTAHNRLLFKVYQWDRNLFETRGLRNWSYEVNDILVNNNLGHIFNSSQIFPVKATAELLKKSMQVKQQEIVQTECETKAKLRTFLTFKDFKTVPPHIGKPLTFVERRIISKLRLGILPIRIETARYVRPVLPEDQRLCYCNSGEIESEVHLLFQCSKYKMLREGWLKKLCIPTNFENLPTGEKLKLVLNVPENVRHTAKFLVSAMDSRSLLNKDY